jgi:hypothetical protein
LVIEREVIARNDVDTSLLLNLPMIETESFALTEQFVAGELASPVGLGGFLEITVHSHAREAED